MGRMVAKTVAVTVFVCAITACTDAKNVTGVLSLMHMPLVVTSCQTKTSCYHRRNPAAVEANRVSKNR